MEVTDQCYPQVSYMLQKYLPVQYTSDKKLGGSQIQSESSSKDRNSCQ